MSPAYKIILNSHLKTQKWGEKWLKKKKMCHSLVQDFRASKNSIFRRKKIMKKNFAHPLYFFNEKIRRASNQFGVTLCWYLFVKFTYCHDAHVSI